eukprot:scaffold20734_cov118-Isochrysis_galbana.AAC.4
MKCPYHGPPMHGWPPQMTPRLQALLLSIPSELGHLEQSSSHSGHPDALRRRRAARVRYWLPQISRWQSTSRLERTRRPGHRTYGNDLARKASRRWQTHTHT